MPGAAPDGPLSLLARMAKVMGAQTEAMVDPDVDSTIEAAARRLCQARVIWIAARGDVAPIGQLLMIRLRRYRLRARPLARDGAGGLARALPGDVLVEVAGHFPENRHEGLRRRAAVRGLTLVLIGPVAGADGVPPPDLHIPVRPGQTGDAMLAGQWLGALALASTVIQRLRSGALHPGGLARGRMTGP